MIAHMGRVRADDPLGVMDELRAVLDHSELSPPIRYALSVMLVAEEVCGTVQGPFPHTLQRRVSDLLDELRVVATAGQATSYVGDRRIS